MAISTLPCLLLSVSAILFAGFAEGGSVGVNYRRDADSLPPPLEVVRLLQSQGINKVKIYDSDHELLTALSNSGITVASALPNTVLSSGERIDLYEKARGKYIVNESVLKVMQKHAIVMHPLPRLDEITIDVDGDPRAAHFRQAKNGLYIRMTLLKLLLLGW